MADPIELTFFGDWKIKVVGRDAAWQQRVVARNTATGTRTLSGLVGNTMDIYGDEQNPWKLAIEHNDGSSGWQPSWLRSASFISGGMDYIYTVDSEDITTSSSDRDFNDLSVHLSKLGAASQPTPPFAIMPNTLQAMPEVVFEASLGRYFMAVRVQNIWTRTWPDTARVGLTQRCRSWLAAGGAQVVDDWPNEDQAAMSQRVVGGAVVVGSLPPWESRLIYFKVDVANAAVRKHQVEIQVHGPTSAENLTLLSKKAKAPIFVSRTVFDPDQQAFVSECDVGVLTAGIKELVLDHSTFKRAIGNARKILNGSSPRPGTPGQVGALGRCDPQELERIRRELRAFLAGKKVDLCAMYRDLVCCCAGGTPDRPGKPKSDPWTDGRDPGLSFFAWPTIVDYSIEYKPPFTGQFGPFPFEDPWWKVLLIILAILLSLASAASSIVDLASRSDEVVIGSLTRSILNATTTSPATLPAASEPGSIDAAVVTLNGNRSLTTAIFSLLDAGTGEFFTAAPINGLDSIIDTPGVALTNAEINTIVQNLADNPMDPAAQAAVRAYKSGARSGLGRGVLSSVVPVRSRTDDDVTIYFLNQLLFTQDADTADGLSCKGDSGSLWYQEGTNAVIGLNHAGSSSGSGVYSTACRIEDVMNQLGIRFT